MLSAFSSVVFVASVLNAWAEKNNAPNSAICATRTRGSLRMTRGDVGEMRHATGTGAASFGDMDARGGIGGSRPPDAMLWIPSLGEGCITAPNERIGGVIGELSEDINVTLLNADASIFFNGVRRKERRMLPATEGTGASRGKTPVSVLGARSLITAAAAAFSCWSLLHVLAVLPLLFITPLLLVLLMLPSQFDAFAVACCIAAVLLMLNDTSRRLSLRLKIKLRASLPEKLLRCVVGG
jgi:hypothetical protein